METKKKNRGLIAIIIILVIIVGIIAVWKIFFDLPTKKSDGIVNKVKENIDSTPQKITDYARLEQISNKITLLESMGPSNSTSGEYIYSKDNLNVKDIPQQYKLYALVNLETNKFDYSNGIQSGYDLIRSKLNSDVSDEVINLNSATISYSFLTKEYNELYGSSDLPKIDLIGEEYCTQLIADDTNEVFYALGECGNVDEINVETYFAEARTSSNKLYADVYLAVVDSDNNVYRDIRKQKLVETNSNFTLDNTNYKKYGHYQYTFNLDDNNNYYFSNIKKIS